MIECRVVLASGSPRRRDLLNLVGIAHEVRPSNIDETMRDRENPRRHAERLAREKATAIATRDPHLITIGADTIVVVNRKVLGKPRDTAHAAEMLKALSGREHTVVTGARGGPAQRSRGLPRNFDEGAFGSFEVSGNLGVGEVAVVGMCVAVARELMARCDLASELGMRAHPVADHKERHRHVGLT